MLSKRPHPMIGKLSESLVSGYRSGLTSDGISTASIPSPRSPLIEYRIQSPRGLKNYDLGGGVGLGIVAALEKSRSKKSLTRSDPIPVGSCKVPEQMKGGGSDGMGMEMETESLEENYTYVTSHRPEKSFTKVYYGAGEYGKVSAFSVNGSMPKESPCKPVGDVSVYPTSNFLNSCHLCEKKLHGKDIYMYRGEKAFCSVECRSRQIMVDEHREQCRSEIVVPRSVDVSSSPYTASPVFSTGILAI